MIDLHTPQHHTKHGNQEHKVNYVRNRNQHLLHVENVKNFIGTQFELLVQSQEVLQSRHQTVHHKRYQSQIHSHVKYSRTYPLQTLHETIINQLHQKQT